MRREIIGPCELWLGDCRDVVAESTAANAVVSDPPYGIGWNTDSTRFTGGGRRWHAGRDDWRGISGDDAPFDPAAWLKYPECILFGANHFLEHLPPGGLLVDQATPPPVRDVSRGRGGGLAKGIARRVLQVGPVQVADPRYD